LSRITVAIASLLKPVDDARMYEKLGLSLAQTNKYEINIIGFSIKKNNFHPDVKIYPVFRMSRTGISRFFQPLRYFRVLLKVKPEVIIVNSFDLLFVTLFYSGLTGSTFIYDVQENYLRNIRYNSPLPWPVKILAGVLVRTLERIAHPFVDHYLVAEESYFNEMPYLAEKGVLLRNYYSDSYGMEASRRPPGDRIRILYSGTIAGAYGIFGVIDFIVRFYTHNPGIELVIAGYCPHRGTLEKLKEIIRGKPYIHLSGGDRLLPHEEIINKIRQADFGIIRYELNPAIRDCFPTRIYEYMGNRLPMLIQEHPVWSEFCTKYDAGLVVNFESFDPDDLWRRMRETDFYPSGIPEGISWNQEEPKLLKLFSGISARR
jgi:hypothetical protein